MSSQNHLEMAARLRNNFNNEHVMLVFKVHQPGGCSGDLVTTPDGKVSPGDDRRSGHVATCAA
jgi:hypothetical protein